MKKTAARRAALLALLVLTCLTLSACYMEPDRVVDPNNGLNVGDQGQNFQNVITPTPTVTITPTPAPTSNAVDWSSWDFGADTATNPPSGVTVPTAPSVTGGITAPTSAPNIISSTVSAPPQATPRPTTKESGDTQTKSSTLKVGSEGSDVKRLQQRLKDLGYYTGSVDGKFGQGTEQAVRDFQAAHKLTVDGKAGKSTQTTLYGSNAKKKTASTVTAKPASGTKATPKPSNTSSYTNGKTDIYLEVGSGNAKQIKIMQNRLIVLGYLSGTADGEYGATTEAAVKAFQDRNGLYADGKAGPQTLAKLYSNSAKKANSVAGHLGSLKAGMNGNAVRTLQKNLRTLGYYNGSVDGDYGSGTQAAVSAFQSANGLKADGVAGKATLNAIQNVLSGGTTASGSSGSKADPDVYGLTASSGGYTSLSASSGKRDDVTALQSVLQANGYYNGTVDGSYGGGTSDAVKKYQRAAGLRVTGVAGPCTQRLLYNSAGETGSYSKLQMGSSGSAVKRLQYALYELKYYDGDITGTYDNKTENAVMAFQEVNGLFIDGIAGQDTQRRLYSSKAVPSNI